MKFVRFPARPPSFILSLAMVVVSASLPVISCHAQVSAGLKSLSDYRQEEKELRGKHDGGRLPRKEILAQGAKWRTTFSKVLEKLKEDDPGRTTVLWEAALLAHQAGDHGEALKLSDEAARSCTKPDQAEERAYISTNAAMVAFDAYAAEETSEHLDRAMKRFVEASTLLNSLGEHHLGHGLEFLQKFADASRLGGDRTHEMFAYQAGIEMLEKNPKAGEALLKDDPGSSFSKEWFQKKLQELKEKLDDERRDDPGAGR